MRPVLTAALHLLPVLVLLLGVPSLAQPAGANSDKELLLAFKASLTNGAAVLIDWTNTTEPCAGNWLGITCDADGRVTHLELTSRRLGGEIPDPFWTLPEKLEVLDMYQNRLSGTLPQTLSLPAGLQGFFLDSNLLTGTIPESWVLPETLTGMYLGGGNNLNGTLPVKLVLPAKLERLQLGGTQLGGTIPGAWKLPDSLKFLYLQGSQLTGQIPEDWKLPANLERIQLFSNRLNGTLPFRLALPPKLKRLELEFNNISGTLAPDWQLPDSLEWLDIGGNRLTGTIPYDFKLPASMNVFNPEGNGMGLYENQLEGPLPSWPTFPNAIVFVKPDNDKLCGNVPSSPIYKIIENAINKVNNKFSFEHQTLQNLTACPPGVYASQPPPEQSSTSPPQGGPGGTSGTSNTAAIVGGVVGGVACIALVGGIGWWVMRRRRKRPPGGANAEKGEEVTALAFSPANRSDTPSKMTSNSSPKASDAEAERNGEGLNHKDPLISSILAHLGSASSTPQHSMRLPQGNSGSLSSDSSGRRLNVDVKLWLLNFQDLELSRQIGRGSFGRVYLAQWKEGTQVAVKLLLGDEDNEVNADRAASMALSQSNPILANLEREASMMAALRHPNVLAFLGVCTAPPCLVLEYCPRGSLYDILRQARATPSLHSELDWTRRLEMALGTASGMLYLHTFNPPLVHRDLRTPNLLVSSDWTVKVSDFNLSRILGEASAQRSAAVTNPRWLAPEVLAGESHTCASDVYSFGAIMYELLTFSVPWEEHANPWQVVMAVLEGRTLSVPAPDQVPGGSFVGLEAYITLMQHCWAQDPQARPDFSEISAELCRLLAELKSHRANEGSCPDNDAQFGVIKRCTWDGPEPITSPFAL